MRCCGGVRVGRPTSRREAPPDDRLRETFDRTGGCLMGFSRAQPTSLKGIGMKTTGFQRPAAAVFAGAALAATIAAFALGLAHAQTVNPVPPPPPPTFNPSTPNTVPQAPYVPVAPSAPSSPSVSAPRAEFAGYRAVATGHAANGQSARRGKARSIATARRPSPLGSPPLEPAPRPLPRHPRARPRLLSGPGRI